MSEITIELNHLNIGYHIKNEERVVGFNLNASLRMGELTCLLGPNGAGKSTLLRTISGFQPALSGEVTLLNRLLPEFRSDELSKVVSVVLTDNSAIRNMTVYEVVAMGRSPYTGFWGRMSENDKNIVDKCMSWVDILRLKNRKMQTLSDGERQKVMIAKAIAQETPIILLDEPTAFLDYPSKVSMMLLLHRLAKTLDKTIFLSTHDVEHAMQIADQIWLLDKERGLTTGTPEDLSRIGAIEDYFLRDSIAFDKRSCTFRVIPDTPREVIVCGNKESLDFTLCCKALQRCGILPVEYCQNQKVKVFVPGDGTFRLLQHDKEVVCVNKIEHLLRVTVQTIVGAEKNDKKKS